MRRRRRQGRTAGGKLAGATQPPRLAAIRQNDHHHPKNTNSIETKLEDRTMFQKLHHVAYRCRDAQATVDFYTKVLGLKYAAGEASPEGHKPYGEEVDLIHIFFECSDGSYIAFFDLPSSPPAEMDRNTPNWVNHIAFEVPSMDALLEGKRRLEAAGVDVLGPKDHRFCQSIYFFDPNGIRLEMTLRTEAPGELHRMESVAGEQLAAWNARKQRKYGTAAEAV
jgi:glyoxylase I family protein